MCTNTQAGDDCRLAGEAICEQRELTAGAQVVLDGLEAKPSMNGTSGTLLHLCANGERWAVELPDGSIKVKPSNLRLHVRQPLTIAREGLAASLHARDYAICDDFLTADDASALHALLNELRASLNAGDIAGGRAAAAYARVTKQAPPRGDLMRFLDEEESTKHPEFRPVFAALDAMVGTLQASPLIASEWTASGSSSLASSASPMRLSREETQLTCYPGGGARYVRHVDNNNNNGRHITCILYSNPNWQPADGGELRLYARGRAVDVAPLANRLVLFWSDARVPHEVLPSHADRYAVSVWYCARVPTGGE